MDSPAVVKELTPKLQDDFLSFFDHDAFADNPEWADCYCMFRYFVGSKEEWSRATKEYNRKAIAGMIRDRRAQGFLAYVDSKPVGWCNAAPRNMLPGLERSSSLHVNDAEKVGSIVCFLVAKKHRGQGIARLMLESAVQNFRQHGLAYAEAYPIKYPPDSPLNEPGNFPGPLSMYLDAGFTPYKETELTIIVRKALKPSIP